MAMATLSDNDRGLWLSRYLDGELDDTERQAVEQKLREDAAWRAELEALQRADRAAQSATRRYHEDDGFSRRVAERAKTHSAARPAPVHALRHHHRRPRARSGSWLLRAAALVALAAGAAWAWRYYDIERTKNTAARPPVAPAVQPPAAVTEEFRAITWADGTRIVARKGSVIEKVDDRTLRLSGEALFRVARNERPFSVHCGPHTPQALGTRFTVKSGPEGVRVRVAEGHVRATKDGATAEAFGGMEILPDLKTRSLDPREVSTAWLNAGAEDLVPPWPQLGGAATHTGQTPLAGPASLVARPELFFSYPDGAENGGAGAVISADQRAYVLVQSGPEHRVLELALSGAAKGAWKTVARSTNVAPVITPQGMVVYATNEGAIAACASADVSSAWTQTGLGGVRGLCAAPDGRVLVSAQEGLIALDGRDGKVLWRCTAAQDLKLPATVLPSGAACAVAGNGTVSMVDRAGQVVSSVSWPRALLQPPAVASDGDALWLTSADGYVARLTPGRSGVTEKQFGLHLRCGPLPSGLLVAGAAFLRFDQPGSFATPAGDGVIALAQGAQQELYAAQRRSIVRLRGAADVTQMKTQEYCAIADGEIVRHGVALIRGRLIVTTTRGVQVFE
jgi:ferric-dicitrate binding protein FerR (iron transport regulator)